MQAAIILAIIEKLLTYGPRAVITIAAAFDQEEDPTLEQIRNLKIDKGPEDYFS